MTDTRTNQSSAAYPEAMAAIGLPERTQQAQLAEVISRPSGVFAVEAPTATGKSIGGLIGAALHVKEHGGRAVIATYTNLLREQYEDNEIPAARKAFPDVSFYSVAGANNYLCAQRANDALKDAPGWARPGLEALRDRLRKNPAHTLLTSTTDEKFRRFAQADTDVCGDDSRCKSERDGGCGFRNARRAAAQATVVITNHALLSINAQLKGLILGEFSVTIVDECHKLPAALSDQLTRTVTSRSLARLSDVLERNFEVVMDLADAVDEIETADGDKWENWPAEFNSTRLTGLAKHAARAVDARMHTVETEFREHSALDEDGGFNPKCPDCVRLSREATRAGQLQRLVKTVSEWMACCRLSHGTEQEKVGTVEIRGSAEKPYPQLKVTPTRLDRAARSLIESTSTLVFMSATVGSVSDPVYSLTACGIADALDEVLFLEHPLNYPAQMDLVLDSSPDFFSRLDRAIGTYSGSAMVLTSSHRMKHRIADRIERLVHGKIRVYTQPDADKAASRKQVFEQFRADTESVLVGVDSYYEGVNAPGETLRHVVIAAMPRRESGPVAQQIDANLRLAGSNFHQVHQAPRIEMVLQQMMGRVIRAETDFGRVSVIADSDSWGKTRVLNAASRFGAIPVHTLVS